MSEGFHEIALTSILFKGRSDIYFCYLKAEKIAHVLGVLVQQTSIKDSDYLHDLVALSSRLPNTILHFAAGEIEPSVLLADVLSLISSVRLSATHGFIRRENTTIIEKEYELLARKIAAENHPSPFVSSKDFAVEEVKMLPASQSFFGTPLAPIGGEGTQQKDVKDTHKHQELKDNTTSDRMSLILDFVKQNKGVSIKDIAKVVKGCSEKTIQRELAVLIERGLVERKGERRWSVYTATPKAP